MSKPLCVIVGAGDGLGQALTKKFVANGFDIALISRTNTNSLAAINAGKQIDKSANIKFFPGDAHKPKTIECAFGNIMQEMSDINTLIYNVRGAFTCVEPLNMSYQDLLDTYHEEVIGAFAAAKSILPSMIKRSSGSIFFSSATAAFRGSANYPLYSIGKFGLRALSQSLTKAYAKNGVHIVHFRIDCDLDVPIMHKVHGNTQPEFDLASADAVAETYWLIHQQPKAAWSNEVEVRPYTEAWTY